MGLNSPNIRTPRSTLREQSHLSITRQQELWRRSDLTATSSSTTPERTRLPFNVLMVHCVPCFGLPMASTTGTYNELSLSLLQELDIVWAAAGNVWGLPGLLLGRWCCSIQRPYLCRRSKPSEFGSRPKQLPSMWSNWQRVSGKRAKAVTKRSTVTNVDARLCLHRLWSLRQALVHRRGVKRGTFYF